MPAVPVAGPRRSLLHRLVAGWRDARAAALLHELSHGIAMILTGAGFDHIVIYRDTSGLAYAYTSVGSFSTAIIAAEKQ